MPNLPMPEGLTDADLECVMLDLPSLDLRGLMGENFREYDLYYGEPFNPKEQWIQGCVGDEIPHVTLLFGIHPSDDYELDVLTKLEDWEPPKILIDTVEVFPTGDGDLANYHCVVAKVVPSRELVLANRALAELPHTNRWEYNPHVTLAYLKRDADLEHWVHHLNAAVSHKIFESLGLNLGHDD